MARAVAQLSLAWSVHAVPGNVDFSFGWSQRSAPQHDDFSFAWTSAPATIRPPITRRASASRTYGAPFTRRARVPQPEPLLATWSPDRDNV